MISPTFPGGLRRGDLPDGWLPPRLRDRPRYWGDLTDYCRAHGALPPLYSSWQKDKLETEAKRIRSACSRARKGMPQFVALLVHEYRTRWNVSDFCLCAMFWDCARVQGTELRSWLEEAAR